MNRFLTVLLIPFLMMNASAQPQPVLPDYLVTEITITCPRETPSRQHFSDAESIRLILQYLRETELYEQADIHSMDENAPLYTVTLTHVTGRQTVYRQKGTEYLSKDDSPWYTIDPAIGKTLLTLYRS